MSIRIPDDPMTALRVFEHLERASPDGEFTVGDAKSWFVGAPTTIRSHLHSLVRAGLLERRVEPYRSNAVRFKFKRTKRAVQMCELYWGDYEIEY